MTYVLIVDDEIDLLELLELFVASSYSGEIVTADSGEAALDVLRERGAPLMVVSDYRMPHGDGVFLKDQLSRLHPKVPFVICSGNPIQQLQTLFPQAQGYVVKPDIREPLIELVRRFTGETVAKKYVRVPLQTLMRLGIFAFDSYVRLSEQKYVKVRHASEPLGDNELDELLTKYRGEIYITETDAIEMGEALLRLTRGESHSTLHTGEGVENALSAVLSFAEVFGWTEDAVKASEKFIVNSIAVWSKQKDWMGFLPSAKKHQRYNSHVLRVAQLSYLFAEQAGLTTASAGEKLTMAAMLHDATIAGKEFEDTSTFKEESWRDHPLKTAEMARKLPGVLNDVDHIILQHHERPDGKGYPRGLFAQQISPLSAVFILAHEFLDYVGDRAIDGTLLEQFKLERSSFLKGATFGRFAPIFEQGT
jgi:response regulator RpfG family c-di-GMP phosphodiesterase